MITTILITASISAPIGFVLCALLTANKSVDVEEAQFIVESERERWQDVNSVFDRFEKLLIERRYPGHADLRFALALLGRATGRVPNLPAMYGETHHDN